MMKIHTTQDLNSLVQTKNQQTTNSVSKDFRLKNYSEQMLMPRLSAEKADFYSTSVSFGAKNLKDAKKIINTTKKVVGEIKKEANPEVKRGDKFLTSSLFHKALNVVEFETVVTATVAAIACAARAGTIMALPTKKNKEDNRYAASHAAASGIIGFMTAFALTAPFKAGSNYVMKHLKHNLSEKTLKRLYPHLDINSINENGVRKAVNDWKDRAGNKFVEEMKDCDRLPRIKYLAEVSEQTFNKLLLNNKEVDWAAQKGKSFNDVVLKDGKKLYDEIDMSNIGIKVKEDGMDNAQILLKDLDRTYLENLVRDAKEQKSYWGDLDVSSVYKNGEVVDFRQWKDVNGKQWKLDLDQIGVSSPYETAYYKPRISGKKRLDPKENVYKFTTYQKNGNNGKLGTEIENDMVVVDAANDGLFKLLTWGPDLLFRVPVAAATIALIPWVLKNIFNVQKSAKQKTNEPAIQNQPSQENNIDNKEKSINFKGKKPNSEQTNWFIRKFGEWYGKPLIENEKVHKASSWLSKLPGNVTQHMTAFGSMITSGVYMQQTLTKKDLDPDRRRTLTINQGLCFVVPTAAAYTVDKAINGWVKRKGYRLAGLTEHEIDIAKLENKAQAEIENKMKDLGKKSKGIRTLSSITIFALIYRYLTPVLMTPAANWFGDKLNAKKAAQRAAQQAVAKEVSIQSEEESKESKQVA